MVTTRSRPSDEPVRIVSASTATIASMDSGWPGKRSEQSDHSPHLYVCSTPSAPHNNNHYAAVTRP